MSKHASKEAFYERLRELAEVSKPSIKESRNLGELIDYKRAADGIAYGIIREQHHYYIKKAGTKENPNVSDFAYIGGLENIKEYQYGKLSEADKQRSMILHTINEAVTSKPSLTGSRKKKRLNEDKAGEEIEKASEKVGDLDAATDVAATPAPEVPAGDEMAAGLEAEPEMPVDTEVPSEPAPEGDAEASAEVPAGEETPAGDEEVPAEEPSGEEIPAGAEEVPAEETEIDKMLGKLTNVIRKSQLEPTETKSYLNTFVASFKDKLRDVDIEDRKEIANKILKVVTDDEIEDLGANVPQNDDEEPAIAAEDVCAECGGFGKYAESRGYDSPEAFMESGEEEQGNVISGYANAYNDGQNDGDFKMVALLITPEMLEKLKGEYGHDDYAEKLAPEVNSLAECKLEEKQAQINELWGGLGGAFKKVGGDIGAGLKKGAQAVAEKVGQYATGVKQAYHTAEVPGEIKKLEGIAQDLGKQIAALNTRLTKAGKQPVNVQSILTTIKNQLGGAAGAPSLGKYGVAAEGMVDPANVEVQPTMLKEDDEPEEDTKAHEAGEAPEEENAEQEFGGGDEIGGIDNISGNGFAPEGQVLGGAVAKPEGAGVEIQVTPDKTVNISMNEGDAKSKGKPFEKIVKEEKPSAGLSKEKKSEIVKSAKKGEDIGKPGKGFGDVAKSAAKQYGSKESGEKVAAAAMWKNVKREGEEGKPVMSESESKLRKYIRARLEEKAGLRKARLTEGKKSETLQKLDAIIDEQFKLYEGVVLKKKVNEGINEVFGLSVADKFPKLDPNDVDGVNKLFTTAFHDILINPHMSIIGDKARGISTAEKYNLIKQYVEGNGGTLRLDKAGRPIYMSKQYQSTGIQTPQGGGSTGLRGI